MEAREIEVGATYEMNNRQRANVVEVYESRELNVRGDRWRVRYWYAGSRRAKPLSEWRDLFCRWAVRSVPSAAPGAIPESGTEESDGR